jgi:hypothetical protein
MITIIALSNIAVGIFIGISGIAGFLLPILYTGAFGLILADSMTMSFAAFLVSGIIGSYFYYKSGDIDMPIALKMGAGSLVGSLLGVFLNNFVPVMIAKCALYVMVLLSGASLILRKNKESSMQVQSPLIKSNIFLFSIGLFIALISSFTGAGGPILSVPLLTNLGISIRKSVGISLFTSIFIALSAFIGYQQYTTLPNISTLVIICMVTHGIGVMFGASISEKINPKLLKNFIALVSVFFSVFMLYKVF